MVPLSFNEACKSSFSSSDCVLVFSSIFLFLDNHFSNNVCCLCWLFVFLPVLVGLFTKPDRKFVFLIFCGEFDPGSGRTLAACLTHASRTERPKLAWVLEWRTGE